MIRRNSPGVIRAMMRSAVAKKRLAPNTKVDRLAAILATFVVEGRTPFAAKR
jgi:hypothetical protein